MTIRSSKRPHVVPITAPSFATPPRPYVYRKIAYTFIAFTILMVVAVLWLSSVRASVDVQAKHDQVTLDGVVQVAKDPQPGQLPGQVVQITVSKIQEFAVNNLVASSTAAATSTPDVTPPSPPTTNDTGPVLARGTVHIINNYSKPQTLVKTTRLQTADGKLFHTDKTITIPAGGKVDVGVYADQPGADYAIGPSKFTIIKLWIDLQKLIYAESDTPFVATPISATDVKAIAKPSSSTGSATSSAKIVTAQNIADAQAVLQDALLQQAKQALSAEVTDPRFTDVVYLTKVLEPKTNVSVGQSADTFLASIKLDVTAVYFSKEDMLALVRSKLKERIPDGREFLPFNDQSITFTVSDASAQTENASVQVHATANYQLTSTSPLLQKSLIAGKSKQDALSLLQAVDGVQSVTIDIHPSWMSKIPALLDHIDLKVE